jgi:hypothetical protein
VAMDHFEGERLRRQRSAADREARGRDAAAGADQP